LYLARRCPPSLSKLVHHPSNASLSLSLATSGHALLANGVHEMIVCQDMTIEGVERWADSTLVAEHLSLEPPRQHSPDLVLHVVTCRHRENVIKLLERSLFSLGYELEKSCTDP